MTQSTIDKIRGWLLPVVLAILCAACGLLWTDMREQIKGQADKLSMLNDAVVRLTALQEKEGVK